MKKVKKNCTNFTYMLNFIFITSFCQFVQYAKTNKVTKLKKELESFPLVVLDHTPL